MKTKKQKVPRAIKDAFKKKPKASAAPKLTAEQLSDREQQRLALHHKNKIKPLLLAEKAAKAAVAKAKELAKKEGVPWKELQILLALESEEGADKFRVEMERILRLDRWAGTEIGEQLELFAKQSNSEKSFEDGRRAALNGEPRKPPLHLSDGASKHWISGHEEGTAQQNKARQDGMGFKTIGEVASDVIGDQAATHKEAA